MNNSYYNITLDIKAIQSQITLSTKQADTSRVIYISLTDGGKPYTIGEKCFAVFEGKKSDGAKVGNHCYIENNRIVYPITAQTVASPGIAECEISLYDADGGLITSPKFTLIVDPRIVGDDDFKSSQEFTSLAECLAEVRTAENIRIANENARKAALVKVIDENSTYEQYASARAAYEYGEGIRADILPILNTIQGENTVEEVNVWELDTGIYRLIGSFNYMQNTEFKPYNEIGGLVTTGVLIVTKNAWDVSWMLIGVTAMHGYQYYRGEVKVDGSNGSYTKIFQTVDSDLDENSENPVMNKVVTEWLIGMGDSISKEFEKFADFEKKANKLTEFTESATYDEYYSAKVVNDMFGEKGEEILTEKFDAILGEKADKTELDVLKIEIQGSLDEIGDLVGGEDSGTGEYIPIFETAECDFTSDEAPEGWCWCEMELNPENRPSDMLSPTVRLTVGDVIDEEFSLIDNSDESNTSYVGGNKLILGEGDSGENYIVNFSTHNDYLSWWATVFCRTTAGTYPVTISYKVVAE